jgi:hypothetical protein
MNRDTNRLWLPSLTIHPKIRAWILDEAPDCHFLAFFYARGASLTFWLRHWGAKSSFFGA